MADRINGADSESIITTKQQFFPQNLLDELAAMLVIANSKVKNIIHEAKARVNFSNVQQGLNEEKEAYSKLKPFQKATHYLSHKNKVKELEIKKSDTEKVVQFFMSSNGEELSGVHQLVFQEQKKATDWTRSLVHTGLSVDLLRLACKTMEVFDELQERISSPDVLHQMNVHLIINQIAPKIIKNQPNSSPEDVAKYLAIQFINFEHGIHKAYSQEEDLTRYDLEEELINKSGYTLRNPLFEYSRVSKIPNDDYKPIIKILVNELREEAYKMLVSEITPLFRSEYDIPNIFMNSCQDYQPKSYKKIASYYDDIDKIKPGVQSISSIPYYSLNRHLNSLEKYQPLKILLNEAKVLKAEHFKKFEELYTDKMMLSIRDESKSSNDQIIWGYVFEIEKLDTPIYAAPKLISYLREKGEKHQHNHHASNHVSRVFLNMLDKISLEGKEQELLNSMPEQDRKITKLLLNSKSNLKKYANLQDSLPHYIYRSESVNLIERLCPLLLEENTPHNKLYELYYRADFDNPAILKAIANKVDRVEDIVIRSGTTLKGDNEYHLIRLLNSPNRKNPYSFIEKIVSELGFSKDDTAIFIFAAMNKAFKLSDRIELSQNLLEALNGQEKEKIDEVKQFIKQEIFWQTKKGDKSQDIGKKAPPLENLDLGDKISKIWDKHKNSKVLILGEMHTSNGQAIAELEALPLLISKNKISSFGLELSSSYQKKFDEFIDDKISFDVFNEFIVSNTIFNSDRQKIFGAQIITCKNAGVYIECIDSPIDYLKAISPSVDEYNDHYQSMPEWLKKAFNFRRNYDMAENVSTIFALNPESKFAGIVGALHISEIAEPNGSIQSILNSKNIVNTRVELIGGCIYGDQELKNFDYHTLLLKTVKDQGNDQISIVFNDTVNGGSVIHIPQRNFTSKEIEQKVQEVTAFAAKEFSGTTTTKKNKFSNLKKTYAYNFEVAV